MADGSHVDALVERFVSCLAEEGADADPEARSALREALAPLADTFGDLDCTTDPAGCTAAINTTSCEELAGTLEPAVAPPTAGASAPEWALRYVDALLGRVLACYETETGTPANESETAALGGWRDQLAGVLGDSASSNRCEVVTEMLDACCAELAALSCESLAEGLGAAATLIGEGDESPCTQFLDCHSETDAMLDDAMHHENTVVGDTL